MIKAKPFSLEEMLEKKNLEAFVRKAYLELFKMRDQSYGKTKEKIDGKHSNQVRKCDKSF